MSGLAAHLVGDRESFELDIELVARPGETVALLGPNGAGKTTALHMLLGWEPLLRGRVELDGTLLDEPEQEVFVPPERRNIGVALQDAMLFPHLSVIDNVAFAVVSGGAKKASARAAVAPLIEAFDLGALAERRPNELSGGQAQRVALARALANEPALLLLDEPMAALDVSTRLATRELLLARLEELSIPSVLVTHDPTDANVLADRIVVVEHGRVTQVGTPEDIRRKPQSSYAADLVGINLLMGDLANGVIGLDESGGPGATVSTITTSDRDTTGRVLVTIHPRAVALHRHRPDGSPRNAWRSTVERVEPVGDTSRVQLGAPIPLTAEITPGAAADLELDAGREIWVAVKATEVRVSPV